MKNNKKEFYKEYNKLSVNDNRCFSDWLCDELTKPRTPIAQQSLSGSDDKSSSAQICNDFEEGERCTKGLRSTCGKCGYLSDADF
jgi:hypothetical protein